MINPSFALPIMNSFVEMDEWFRPMICAQVILSCRCIVIFIVDMRWFISRSTAI